MKKSVVMIANGPRYVLPAAEARGLTSPAAELEMLDISWSPVGRSG
jgi:hypothetical protein